MSVKKAVYLCSTILVGGLASAALSQSAAPAQTALALDDNGVDLVSGSFNLSHTDISIGPAGPGGLTYTRTLGLTGWSTNIDVKFYSRLESGQTYVYVQRGLIADRFLQSGTTFSSTVQNGSLLTQTGNVFVYTAPDATEITATLDEPNPGNKLTRINSVKFPSGQRNIYFYNVIDVVVPTCTRKPCTYRTYQRLSSVTNDAGYQLKMSYQTNVPVYSSIVAWQTLASIMAINNAVDYCDPSASTCSSLTTAWPVVTYSDAVSGNNLIRTVTDANGAVWRYKLDSISTNGSPIAIKRPGSTTDTTLITRDSGTGNVSALTRDGQSWSYTFTDLSGTRTAIVTDGAGNSNHVVSNIALGRPLSATDPLNRTTAYQYDTYGRLTRLTRPEGNYTSYVYDGRGNVTMTTNVSKTPGTPADIVTSANYDSTCTNVRTCNQPNWTRDANGSQSDYTYDPTHGGVLTVTLPSASLNGVRPQSRYAYTALQAYFKDATGSIVASGTPSYKLTGTSTCQTTTSCVGTADEVVSTINYGSQVAGTANNLLPVSASAGSGDGLLTAANTFTYDGIGNRLTVDGPLPGTADTTRTRYDAGRQVIGVVSPSPGNGQPNRAQQISYNLDSQVTMIATGTVTDQSDTAWTNFTSLQQALTTYDANALKVKDVVTAGGTTYSVAQYSYDAIGRRDCSAVRMDPTQWASQANVCVPQTTGVSGPDRISRNTYDAASQVTKVTSAYGTPDAADDVTSTYTLNGKDATIADANGNLTTYAYDGLDRLSQTHYPLPSTPGSSSTTDYEQPSYDVNGNVTQRRLRDGQTISYTYDNLNRLTAKQTPKIVAHDNNVNYQYDLLGRMTQALDSDNLFINFAYDALGRVTSEQNNWTARTFQYDLAGRRTRLTWGDGFYAAYDRLVTGEVSAVRENGATSGVGVLGTYSYDNVGRLTTLTRGNGVVTSYAFDPVSRLSSLNQDLAGTVQDVTTAFTYNPAGQIATSARSNDSYAWNGHYNVDRAYTVNGLNQLTAAGSTSLGYDGRGNLTTSGSTTYSYTSENRLATGGGYTMTYDPLGRYHWISNTGNSFVWMQYDGGNIVEERDGNGIQRRYVYGPGTDDPLVWYEGSGTTDRRWLIPDERGSVIAVTNASGIATTINSYDEYGIPASTNVGRFQYTGQAWIPELGMYYYKARMYSPTLGRFMQSDPIGYGDGLNMYNYVGSDPIDERDTNGLSLSLRFAILKSVQKKMVDDSGGGASQPDDIVVTGTPGRDSYFGNFGDVPVGRVDLNLGGATRNFGGMPRGAGIPTQKITCVGPARILAGNRKSVQKPGGMLRPIDRGSAAVIPRQFAGGAGRGGSASAYLRSISPRIRGTTAGGQSFNGVDDVINDARIASTAFEAQNIEMNRDPGRLILELVTGYDEGHSTVTITVPGNQCPSDLSPAGGK